MFLVSGGEPEAILNGVGLERVVVSGEGDGLVGLPVPEGEAKVGLVALAEGSSPGKH